VLLCLAKGHGTTAPVERYYRKGLRNYRVPGRYYRKGLRYYRSREQYYRMPQHNNTRSPSFCRDTDAIKTRTAITSTNELRIEQTQACWKEDDE
jgi:hypothetical protein